jgi:hypothetical protein
MAMKIPAKGYSWPQRGNRGATRLTAFNSFGEIKVTQSTGAFPPTGESATTQQSTARVARDEAANVGHSARAGAADVTGTAVDQAANVVDETRRQARNLLGEARSQATEQASAQQHKAAKNLHNLADQLADMATKNGDSGMATQLAEEASNRVHGVASWLEQREPADLLGEVRDFARRRPGTFLIGAALAGVLAGRMTRGVAAAARSGQPGPHQTGIPSAGAPATWPAPAAGTAPVVATDPVYGTTPVPGTGYGSDLPGDGYGDQYRGTEAGGESSFERGQP